MTVTATLSKALAGAVSIPLTVTSGTAEETDHGTLPAITVAAGETIGTSAMTTAMDLDGDDETFTVALDADNLPSGVTAGAPASATVTIDDTVTGDTVPVVLFPNPPAIVEATPGDRQVTLSWSAVGDATGWGGRAGRQRDLDRHRRRRQDIHGDGAAERHGIQLPGAGDEAGSAHGQRLGERLGDAEPADGARGSRADDGPRCGGRDYRDPQREQSRGDVGRAGAGDALRRDLHRHRQRRDRPGGVEPGRHEPDDRLRRPGRVREPELRSERLDLQGRGAGAQRGGRRRVGELGVRIAAAAGAAGHGPRPGGLDYRDPQRQQSHGVVGRPGAGDPLRRDLQRQRRERAGGVEPGGHEPDHHLRQPASGREPGLHRRRLVLHGGGAGAERGGRERVDELGVRLAASGATGAVAARRGGRGARRPQRREPRGVVGTRRRGRRITT